MKLSVQAQEFDAGAEIRALSRDPKVGAVASFVGVVREVGMTLEHYPGMTEKALHGIVEQAKSRWQLLDCTVIHRIGRLEPTDPIVLVAVASAHRGEAFAACEFIMDYLKTQAPFWKKEAAGWVEARDTDERAAERWK
jgi:molybdopterin synthase catalytic subunit